MPGRLPSRPSAHAGFAMMEVLVTIIILLFGLLGLAGLVVRSNTSEMEAYQRVQAIVLAQDMIDRMNANRGTQPDHTITDCYSNGTTGRTRGNGTGNSATLIASDCLSTYGTATQRSIALADLNAWTQTLLGAAETSSGGSNLGAMIGARGCIVRTAAQTYTVSIAYQGLIPTISPTDTCGSGQYGADDTLRRVVTIPVQIGNL
jgi:type IV pilus assembly protein PilV